MSMLECEGTQPPKPLPWGRQGRAEKVPPDILGKGISENPWASQVSVGCRSRVYNTVRLYICGQVVPPPASKYRKSPAAMRLPLPPQVPAALTSLMQTLLPVSNSVNGNQTVALPVWFPLLPSVSEKQLGPWEQLPFTSPGACSCAHTALRCWWAFAGSGLGDLNATESITAMCHWVDSVEMPGHRNALFSLRRHQRVVLSGLCQHGHEALPPRARPGLWGAATGAPNVGGPGVLMLTHLQVSALGR